MVVGNWTKKNQTNDLYSYNTIILIKIGTPKRIKLVLDEKLIGKYLFLIESNRIQRSG